MNKWSDKMEFNIPEYVENILNTLHENGYEAYIVGGAVRDMIMGIKPYDYDINTDALPDDIERVFKDYRTLNVGKRFGTVVVVQEQGFVEVTTFRTDGEYLDGRRPKEVFFSDKLKKDLSRRDFTINAMAYNRDKGLIDYFGGIKDIDSKIIRTVGEPRKRFSEDYLRILRAIRFASQLEFIIDKETKEACKLYGKNLLNISGERVAGEFFKIMLAEKPSYGIRLLKDLEVIHLVLPELTNSIGFKQYNPNHDKDVFEHSLCVLDSVSPLIHLRLAALFHDIGKPYSFTVDKDGIGHFYGHHKIGSKIAWDILLRLKTSNKIIKKTTLLIEKHMNANDDMGEKGIKRLISQMGEEDIFTLIQLQKADRLCSNQNADIEDLIEREAMVREIIASSHAYEKNQLAIDGNDVIKLGYKQGEIIGEIIDYLFEIVLEKPEKNNKEDLIEIIRRDFK